MESDQERRAELRRRIEEQDTTPDVSLFPAVVAIFALGLVAAGVTTCALRVLVRAF